ncbi:MAG: S41 family peptidase [Chitinophagales bacterium]
MLRSVLLFIFILSAREFANAQSSYSKPYSLKFSADTVKHTIGILTTELSIKHPGFYRYQSRATFSQYIDSIKETIKDSLTIMESYRKLKLIIANIHCLHTGLSLSREFRDSLNQLPNLFPFQLYIDSHSAFIVKNYSSDHSILPADEIVSINGQPMGTIIDQLLPLISSDGNNLTLKYEALNHQFPTWYRILDVTGEFTLVIKHSGLEKSVKVSASKYSDIAETDFLIEPVWTNQLLFRIQNNTGFLTIHSFAKTDIKKSKQNFKEFIDQSFAELKTKGINNLIVDLRNNTGGSDPYAAYFTSYFFNQPFRYWDRIEVTEAIAKEIKGITTVFYKKPLHKESMWLWQKGKHTDEFDFYEEQKPAKNNYSGNTYILMNGFFMSSCSDVTAVLSYNKKAIFIGEETGGAYQGNNSGMIPETKILPFNFTLTVPLQEYFNAVDTSKNIGRGTMPDFPVHLTANERITGEDKSLGLALELIKANTR